MINNIEYYIDNLNVLYEDNHILVVEKKENVLSQKDDTNDFDMNEIVKEWIRRKYNKPGNVYLGLVHRLDRRVGGVMVLAKTSKAASRLSMAIQNHEFEKKYIAYAMGSIDESGEIKLPIEKIDNRAVVSKNGKMGSLSYKVINKDGFGTYLLVDLETGRYNQIRLSFSHINHPLVGDTKYGGCQNERIGLWCYNIGFTHPVSKEWIDIKLLPKGDIWSNLKYK